MKSRKISIESFYLPVSSRTDIGSFSQSPRNILVISPHPDDDVIGMGGTMRLLAGAGYNVFSLYVTDGSSPVFKNKNIHLVRQKEAMAALRAVKARGGIFLGHKSREFGPASPQRGAAALAAGAVLADEIRDIVCLLLPEHIYVPFLFERHHTHRAATRQTITALRKMKGYQPELWGYHVWGGLYGLPGAKTVDITKTASVKRKAIRMHKSQLACKAYDTAMIGRNHYDGVFLETHSPGRFEYAEMFCDMRELLAKPEVTLKQFGRKCLSNLLREL